MEVNFDAPTKTLWFSACIQKRSQFRPPAQKLSQSISALKTSRFRPAHKTKSILTPALESKSISIHKLKPSNFWPAHKTGSILTPAKKNSILIPTLNQVNFDPAHKNQVSFDLITEIKSILIPILISSRFRFPDTKPSISRS